MRDTDGLTIQFLEVIAFTNPDYIPIKLIGSHYLETQVDTFLKIVENYAIVTLHEKYFSIHRTLQSIIRTSIDNNRKNETLELGQNIVKQYLEKLDHYEISQQSTNIHAVTIWTFILDSDVVFSKCSKNLKMLFRKLEHSYDVVLGLPFSKQALQKIQNLPDEEDELILLTKYFYVLVLRVQGKYEDSLNIINEVLSARNDKLGADHKDTVTTMSKKAEIFSNMGKYAEALSIYDQVINIQSEKLGADHSDTLTTINDKALVLSYMGKYEEALSMYNHVISVRRNKLGATHPSTLTTLSNKAVLLHKMGKYDEALILYDEVFNARRDTLGADHPSA
jgi:tetratricopeptide (TPR) repeat protein